MMLLVKASRGFLIAGVTIVTGLLLILIGAGGFYICVTAYMVDRDPQGAAAAIWSLAIMGLGFIVTYMPRLLRHI